jgi:hypothetical protein
LLQISIPTLSIILSFQWYSLFMKKSCLSIDSAKFYLSDINTEFCIIAMFAIVEFQTLFYTQCVVIVMIRIHIAFRVLNSNHSLGTATVVMAKQNFHIRAKCISYVLQKILLQHKCQFFLRYNIMHIFVVLKEVALVLVLFQKLASPICCHY